MKNYELQQILSQFHPQLDVSTFTIGKEMFGEITQVYIGNEKYLHGGRFNEPDKLIIEHKQV